jgi:uncharacterized protein YktB (UPF0637 family)
MRKRKKITRKVTNPENDAKHRPEAKARGRKKTRHFYVIAWFLCDSVIFMLLSILSTRKSSKRKMFETKETKIKRTRLIPNPRHEAIAT